MSKFLARSIDIETEEKILIVEDQLQQDSKAESTPETSSGDAHSKKKIPKHDKILRRTFDLVIWSLKSWAVIYIISLIDKNYISKSQLCLYESLSKCIEYFILPNIYGWFIEILMISFAYSGLMFVSLIGGISRLFLIYIAWNINNLISDPHLLTFGDYSVFFGEWMIWLMQCFFILFSIFGLIAWISRKFPLTSFLIFMSGLGYLGYLAHDKITFQCQDWDKGLGGDKIDNSQYCRIQKPTYCFFDLFNGLFDFSGHTGYECSKSPSSIEILNSLFDDHKLIGFPRMEFTPYDEKLFWLYPQTFLQGVHYLRSYDDPKAKDMEIFLDRHDLKNPKIKINIKKNETLLEERKQIKSAPVVKNVLTIYVDALSRRSAFRHLSKTTKWFEKFYKQESTEDETFQFFKYHSLTPWTYHVHLAMNYGFNPGPIMNIDLPTKAERPEEPYKHIVNDFKEQGFITGRSMSLCHHSGLYTGEDATYKYFVDEMNFDHEGSNLACDPHYHDYLNSYLFLQGSNSRIRRCMYGKDVHDYNIEYGEKFWNTYKDEKKFLWLHLFDAHEDTQSVVKYLDNSLSGFLNRLEASGDLKDTLVMFVSDHGLHEYYNDIAALFESTHQERALPTLFIRAPKTINREYRLNLKGNAQKLVGANDLHNFLKAIPTNDPTIVSKSFFGILPGYRTCTDIGVHSQNCYCTYY